MGLIAIAQRARTNRLLAEQLSVMRTGHTAGEIRAARAAAQKAESARIRATAAAYRSRPAQRTGRPDYAHIAKLEQDLGIGKPQAAEDR